MDRRRPSPGPGGPRPPRLTETEITDIPAPRRSFDAVMEDGAVVRLRQHGNPDGPRLVLGHGNGLAIDGYLPFWSKLLDRYEVLLFDVRNHGQSPPHGASGHDWPTIERDMEAIWQAIRDTLGEKPAIGVCHSLAAVAMATHAIRTPERWRALVLFDPPIFPRDGHELQPAQRESMNAIADRALRRVEHFDEHEGLIAQFTHGRAFQRWIAAAPELMARAILRPDAERGGWTLICDRELEALIFRGNDDPTVWPDLATLDIPVRLICGDPEVEDAQLPSLICRAMAAELPIEYEAIPNTGHMLQIEDPEASVRAMEAFFAAHGLV